MYNSLNALIVKSLTILFISLALIPNISKANAFEPTYFYIVARQGGTSTNEIYRYKLFDSNDSPVLDLTFSDPSLNNIYGINFSQNGELFVSSITDGYSGYLTRLVNTKGTPQYNGLVTYDQFEAPFDAAFRNNELFVIDSVGNKLVRFLFHEDGSYSFNGLITEELNNTGQSGRNIVISPWGEVFVSIFNGSYVYRYLIDTTGIAHYNGRLDGLVHAHDLDFSDWGELFVTDYNVNKVIRYKFDALHNAIPNGEISGNGISGPLGLAFSPWNELFIANQNSNTVSRFIFDTNQIAIANGLFSTPSTLADLEFYPSSPVNLPPVLGNFIAPLDPVLVSTQIQVEISFTDENFSDTHTAIWDWGDNSNSAGIISESNGNGTITGSHIYTSPGVYTMTVTVTDNQNETDTKSYDYIVVYDPNGGFVTGAGSINSPIGAYTNNPSLSGMAIFGFISKYQNGANTPVGDTQFRFQLADLKFKSTQYQWLVVSGPQAKYKGLGTINGNSDYGFLVSATDGEIQGGNSADKFRIKIWEVGTNTIIYDNQLNSPEETDPTTELTAGQIRIHQ